MNNPFISFFRRKRKSSEPLPVIIIPAYNERAVIGRTLELIRKTKIKARIIVIDDGSFDSTSQVAEQFDAHVIRLKKNRGKANAFLAGLKAATRLTPSPKCVVSLDADMTQIPREDLQQLIHSAEKATAEKSTRVIVAGVSEFEDRSVATKKVTPGPFSGIRSFSMPAVHHLVHSRFKSMPKRFELEAFLFRFFPSENVESFPARFSAEPGFRRGFTTQIDDIEKGNNKAFKLLRNPRWKRRFRVRH